MRRILAIVLLLTAVGWSAPPQFGGIFKKKDTQKKDDKDKNKDQNSTDNKDNKDKKDTNSTDNNGQQNLFQGNVNATGSKQKSDTTAMGFSGLNPDGTVESAAMNATPNGTDYANAEKVAGYKVDKSKLSDFIKDGKLKAKGGQR